MDVYTDTICDLSAVEKLLACRAYLVLISRPQVRLFRYPIGLFARRKRRRDEMVADPKLGVAHEDVWKRIQDSRNG